MELDSTDDQMTIWELVSSVTSSEIAVLHLRTGDGNRSNPYLLSELERLMGEHNTKAGEAADIPYIKDSVTLYEFAYIPQVNNFSISDPHASALGQLLRYMGRGEGVRPEYGYHLFSHGRAIGFSQEKTLMEGDARETFKSLSSIFKKGKPAREKQRLRARPLAKHLYNTLSEYYLKEKEDTISRLRREGREGNSLALGTALAFFGLTPDAGPEELSKARKKLIQKSHPDLAPHDDYERRKKEELSRRINQTYEYILQRMGGKG